MHHKEILHQLTPHRLFSRCRRRGEDPRLRFVNRRCRNFSAFVWALISLVYPLWTTVSHAADGPRVILRGDYPDPSILRDGSDYYLTHSPFLYTPGFLIWHSRDLKHWKPICRAMTNVVGSAMAPDLVKHEGKFYIYFPAAGVNWVIWADDVRGPWSDPVRLNVNFIDPGHVVDEKGQRWLFLSEGYRIRLAADGLSVVGEKEKIYAGWDYPANWKTEGKFLESPKLIRKDGWFYLTSAEGGTAGPPTSHMVITARARSIDGPWENSPHNPLVHTYSATEQWWSKGHGTLIDDVNGNWWVVYHAYENGQYPLGRQTLLEPVEWMADGWPQLARAPHRLPAESGSGAKPGLPLSDDFSGHYLGLQWTSWREFSGIGVERNHLSLQATGSDPTNARLLLMTATDHAYEVEVDVTVPSTGTAGLILFYSEKAFAGIASDDRNFTLYRDAAQTTSEANPFGGHVHLKIINRQNRCDFLARGDDTPWTFLLRDVDVSGMHHNRFKGFFALRPSLMAAGSGSVMFRHFVYKPL
jgi:beta-xylosidase